ncbi:MAG TPA: cation:proton antiporter [Candidatus Binataceae bacterium]|nr:cation:proton antiporter [Candidatus Binataceae bacterium]
MNSKPTLSRRGVLSIAIYALTIVGVVFAFFAINAVGMRLTAQSAAPVAATANTPTHVNDLLHVLLALVVVVAAARILGTIFRIARQPPVVGEIIAGIMLGPSLLGRLAPVAEAHLFPPTVAPFLNVLAQVGVILYMFLVGLELDPALLRKRGHATVAISHASIVAPFLLGALLALMLYPRLSSSDVPFTSFALFLGVSMSVTAFPVLARILTDRGIHKTRMGVIALTCAAVDDITGWCLLALVVSVARAHSAGGLRTIALAIVYVAVMILAVRPAMTRLALLYGNRGRLTQGVMAVVFVALLLSSFATEFIGIHAIFGAFALGAVIPHDSGMARELTDRLEDMVVVLLLPAFFAFVGLRTQIGLLTSADQWLLCTLIIVVASAGKFGGGLVASRLTGLGWREGSALGVLMNTRGLMELIVLNIGLELGVISPTLFAMLVLMALVTTFATTPILHLIARHEMLEEEQAAAPAAVVHPRWEIERSAVLVPVSNPQGVSRLVELALAATPPDAPPPRVLALVRPPVGGVRSGLREAERRVTPRSPALSAALDLAWSRGAVITPQAVWSSDPVADILRTANEPHIGWILLGPHRAVFGHDFRGGVVREVMEKARELAVKIGVVIQGGETPFDRVFAIADNSANGRAAIELAARIAQQKDCGLHALLVVNGEGETPAEMTRTLGEAAKLVGRRLHTDTIEEIDANQIASWTEGGLVTIGANLADAADLPRSLMGGGRSLVLAQGATVERAAAEASNAVRVTGS